MCDDFPARKTSKNKTKKGWEKQPLSGPGTPPHNLVFFTTSCHSCRCHHHHHRHTSRHTSRRSCQTTKGHHRNRHRSNRPGHRRRSSLHGHQRQLRKRISQRVRNESSTCITQQPDSAHAQFPQPRRRLNSITRLNPRQQAMHARSLSFPKTYPPRVQARNCPGHPRDGNHESRRTWRRHRGPHGHHGCCPR